MSSSFLLDISEIIPLRGYHGGETKPGIHNIWLSSTVSQGYSEVIPFQKTVENQETAIYKR